MSKLPPSKSSRSSKTQIAILGASGHIGKNLLTRLSAIDGFEILAYGRAPEKISMFLDQENIHRKNISCLSLNDFPKHHVDMVINAIGIGSPKGLQALHRKDFLDFKDSEIFYLTNHYDDLVIDYLSEHKHCLYINLSSGAVYGKDFIQPPTADTKPNFNIDAPKPEDFYGLAKLYVETKHATLKEFKIIDLRIFNFFSHYIDLDDGFIICDMIKNTQNHSVFETTSDDLVRDFVHPEDLEKLILLCFDDHKSGVFDVYSKKPISKFEMLEWFQNQFGLKYSVKNIKLEKATGFKKNYFSENHAAETLGYKPSYSSLNTLTIEVKSILGIS